MNGIKMKLKEQNNFFLNHRHITINYANKQETG